MTTIPEDIKRMGERSIAAYEVGRMSQKYAEAVRRYKNALIADGMSEANAESAADTLAVDAIKAALADTL